MVDQHERERIREWLIDRARADERIVAAAAVGSSAGGGDRWSDLDLTFGIAEGVAVATVLADWTAMMVREHAAAVLFDVTVERTIYRVFLLPGALRVDLSFAPADAFGARGPRFRLLFGEAVERPWAAPPDPDHLFGLGVHHAVRAHVCLARGRLWQAEYWLHAARDQVLTLACHRHGLETSYGRGFDQLPPAVLAPLMGGLVGELIPTGLRRALAATTAGLLREATGRVSSVERVRPMLAALLGDDPVG